MSDSNLLAHVHKWSWFPHQWICDGIAEVLFTTVQFFVVWMRAEAIPVVLFLRSFVSLGLASFHCFLQTSLFLSMVLCRYRAPQLLHMPTGSPRKAAHSSASSRPTFYLFYSSEREGSIANALFSGCSPHQRPTFLVIFLRALLSSHYMDPPTKKILVLNSQS